MEEAEPTLVNADLSVPAVGPNSYTLSVVSNSGNRFDVSREEGHSDLTCVAPGSGGCPTDGTWGN